jgi:hypothetical protein
MNSMSCKHPSIAPWVGPNYEKAKVKLIVVGESHYFQLPEEYEKTYNPNDWYRLNDSQFVAKYHIADGTVWFNTRFLVKRTVDKLQNNENPKIVMFTKIPKLMAYYPSKTEPSYEKIAENLNKIIYFNFFGRPSEKKTSTIKQDDMDDNSSFCRFIEILKNHPHDYVMILSKKSSKIIKQEFANAKKEKDRIIPSNILFLDHTRYRAGWNNEKPGRSLKKIIDIMNKS